MAALDDSGEPHTPLEFTVHLEPGEAVAGHRRFALLLMARPACRVLFLVGVAAMTMVAAFAKAALSRVVVGLVTGWVVVAVIVALAYGAMWVLYGLTARWQVYRARVLSSGVTHLMIDADGVTAGTDVGRIALSWKLVRGFILTERFVFIRVEPRTAFIIPKRVMGPELFQAMVAMAPDRLPIRRHRPFRFDEVVRVGAPRRRGRASDRS